MTERAGFGQGGGVWKDVIADLGAVIDAISPKDKVLLVGHSHGGLLATEFARQYPGRLLGLVLVDPATMAQRHEAMQVNRERVLADDKALWKRQHAALFAGFTRGMHEYLATGHNIHREQPKTVADAIRFVAGMATTAR